MIQRLEHSAIIQKNYPQHKNPPRLFPKYPQVIDKWVNRQAENRQLDNHTNQLADRKTDRQNTDKVFNIEQQQS